MASHTRKVMVAVDESHHSEEALHFFFNNCYKPGQDFLHVVHVLNRPHIFSSRHHDAYRAIIHDVNEKANALKDSYISKLKALVQDEGGFEVFVRGEVDGGVGHTLCKEAFDHDISLIVMSRRGIGLIRRTLMGSVSDYVLHHAHVPIIIVPPCNCQVAKTALQQKTEEAQECQQTEEIS
ncbi:universal stress protein PHOS32 [Nematostella vectensis]|uniref:universal stress protein PHOS32 n=1 Tax=Nematostella vectensis TaxID=45351 RepID=UPI001390330B|nr:universal stress protein PHOS32 [Nematostella vectensis]